MANNYIFNVPLHWKNTLLESFVCTLLYDIQYSYQIEIIRVQLNGFKYSYLILIVLFNDYNFLSPSYIWLHLFLSNTISFRADLLDP